MNKQEAGMKGITDLVKEHNIKEKQEQDKLNKKIAGELQVIIFELESNSTFENKKALENLRYKIFDGEKKICLYCNEIIKKAKGGCSNDNITETFWHLRCEKKGRRNYNKKQAKKYRKELEQAND